MILIFIYLLYIVIRYNIPTSISETYYYLKHKWIFSIVLISSIILTFPSLIQFGYLGFISMVGILFVAYTPNFKDDILVEHIHDGSAILSLVSSQSLVGIYNPILLTLWIPYGIYLIFSRKNYKFWAEIIMLITIQLLLI